MSLSSLTGHSSALRCCVCCPRCAEGYFGQPLIPGSSCQPCQCNDNLDFSIPGSCDSLSGACLICKPGTTGQYCEKCTDGYFGDALNAKNCQRKSWSLASPVRKYSFPMGMAHKCLSNRTCTDLHGDYMK